MEIKRTLYVAILFLIFSCSSNNSNKEFAHLVEIFKEMTKPVELKSFTSDMFKNIDEIGCDFYGNSKISCGSVLIKDMTIGGN